jgi:RNA polymerase sigma factor (sigma-70 family)
VGRSKHRHRAAMERLDRSESSDDFAPSSDDRLDDEPRRDALRTAFGALNPKEQDVLSLCILAEMPLADAATALGLPLGTVKSRLARAKQKLAGLITELTIDAEGGAR